MPHMRVSFSKRIDRSVGLLFACSLAAASAFSPSALVAHTHPAAAHMRAPMVSKHVSRRAHASAALSMGASDEGNTVLMPKGRRNILRSLAVLAGSQVFTLRVQAADGTAAVAGEEAVCNKALGCEIPKILPPPKRVFKGVCLW